MKVIALNKWDFYRILGTGIIAFGLIFNPVEFLEKGQKKKRRKGTVPAGPKQLQCSRPRRAGARARARFSNLTGGPGRQREREGRGKGEDDRRSPPVISNLTTRGVGELTSNATGHGRSSGWHRWTQGDVAVRVVVEVVAGAAWFAGDEVTRRRCFGRRWFRPFPAAKRVGKRGERVSDAARFQIKRKRVRRRPVPRECRRAEAAELELDLELGRLWRQMCGAGG